jgi:hypothetical protein
MVKKIAKVFVIGGLYAGISYFLFILKIPMLEAYVSIPILMIAIFSKDEGRIFRFFSAALGIWVAYGSRAMLLSSETYWRIIFEGIGASLVGGFKSKPLGIIIPAILPTIFWLMKGEMIAPIVNYVITTSILYAIERRERA